MAEAGYLSNDCPHCGGGIEFPAHGVGEWIDCPHCREKIQLCQPSGTDSPSALIEVAGAESGGRQEDAVTPAPAPQGQIGSWGMVKVLKDLARLPSEGLYVTNQTSRCGNYDGGPAVNLKWQSRAFFSKENMLGPKESWFIFTRDASLVAELSEKEAKQVARVHGASAGANGMRMTAFSGPVAGLLGLALGAAAGALSSKTRGVGGIAVLYRNDKQRLGIFDLVGPAEVVGAILACLPKGVVVSCEQLQAEYRK